MSTTIHKEGYLVKAPMSVGRRLSKDESSTQIKANIFSGFPKKSHKRFFVLEGPKLSYFEKLGDGKEKGSLEIGPSTIIKTIENGKGLIVIPYPGSKKELFVSAQDEKEGKDWLDALQDACKLGKEADHEEQKDDEDSDINNDTDSNGEEEEAAAPVKEQKSRIESKTGMPLWKIEWTRRAHPRIKLPHREYQIIKKGYLSKKSSQTEVHWNRRYFVLADKLEYFETEEAFEQDTGGRSISLECLSVVKKNENEFTFSSIGHSYTLRAEDEEQLDQWVESIKSCHKNLRCVSLPTRNPVDTAQKVVPDFLKSIEKQSICEKDNLEQGDEGAYAQGGDEGASMSQLQGDNEGAFAQPPPPPTSQEEDAAPEEDKFAKLRALRAKRGQS